MTTSVEYMKSQRGIKIGPLYCQTELFSYLQEKDTWAHDIENYVTSKVKEVLSDCEKNEFLCALVPFQ